MFAFLFPAGFGVRDGVLVLLLGPQIGVGAATAVAVIARFGTILADLFCAAVAWLWARRHHLLGSSA
jgi:hypothetical protein